MPTPMPINRCLSFRHVYAHFHTADVRCLVVHVPSLRGHRLDGLGGVVVVARVDGRGEELNLRLAGPVDLPHFGIGARAFGRARGCAVARSRGRACS